MAQHIVVGIVFTANENWMGGTYYILNLIHALKTLAPDQRPHLVVFVGKAEEAKLVEETGYPHLRFYPLHFAHSHIARLASKLTNKIVGRKVFLKKHPKTSADVVFPYDLQDSLGDIPHKICWIPDFQEHYLPNFFNAQVIAARRTHQEELVRRQYPIVFSSRNAQQNFHSIYPKAQNPTSVLNFATTHPPYTHLPIADLQARYGISKPYIISPNQFWKHKNHQMILDTVRLLVERAACDFQIVFTGKEFDFRYPDYTDGLKVFVQEHRLGDYIKFLGFIDRQDQLQLMNHALAVIQPSLFEGWSTVVEDAKAMSQFVLASRIRVHEEQLADYPNHIFFDVHDAEGLADLLSSLRLQNLPKLAYGYERDVRRFAQEFLKSILPALYTTKT